MRVGGQVGGLVRDGDIPYKRQRFRVECYVWYGVRVKVRARVRDRLMGRARVLEGSGV